MLEKLKIKLKNKQYAIILNSSGEQIDKIKLNIDKNSFNYQKGTYFYDKLKYNNLELKDKRKKATYFLFIKGYSEPIPFYNINLHKSDLKKPYIAEDFYTLLHANQFRALNNISTMFSNIEPKKLLIGACVVIGIIYFLSNGGI